MAKILYLNILPKVMQNKDFHDDIELRDIICIYFYDFMELDISLDDEDDNDEMMQLIEKSRTKFMQNIKANSEYYQHIKQNSSMKISKKLFEISHQDRDS
jgi:hypothetical protein